MRVVPVLATCVLGLALQGCFGGAFSYTDVKPDSAIPSIKPPAQGQEIPGGEVTLVPGFKTGQKWEFEHRLFTDGASSVPGVIGDIHATGVMIVKGTVEVVAAEGGIPSAVRIAYDPSTHAVMANKNQAYHFAGQTITFKLGESGDVVYEGGSGLDDHDRQQLVIDAMFFLDPPLYITPKAVPVHAGDAWENKDPSWRLAKSVAGTRSESAKCKLLAVRQSDGRKQVEIDFTMKFTAQSNTFEGAGPVIADADTGATLWWHAKGPVRSKFDKYDYVGTMEFYFAVRSLDQGAPKADAPKADAPKADAPPVDPPKVDPPKVDAPNVDPPKVDAPNVDPPKVDAPNPPDMPK